MEGKRNQGCLSIRIWQVAFRTAAHQGTESLESRSRLGNKTAVCYDSQEGTFLECTKSWVSSQHKEKRKEGVETSAKQLDTNFGEM